MMYPVGDYVVVGSKATGTERDYIGEQAIITEDLSPSGCIARAKDGNSLALYSQEIACVFASEPIEVALEVYHQILQL